MLTNEQTSKRRITKAIKFSVTCNTNFIFSIYTGPRCKSPEAR